VLSDTVGFIDSLPTHLIEAFKATLEEVVDADLLIHVLDISDVRFYEHNDVVWDILERLNAADKPTITALNKIDKLEDESWIEKYKHDFSDSVEIAALTGKNLPALLKLIEHKLDKMVTPVFLKLPVNRMDLVDLIYKEGQVKAIQYSDDSIDVEAVLPSMTIYKLKSYIRS
ncbi:MAG: GTPase HflX, partial [Candidatus Omnitrophica bacterium]|nr:GTPase HflX [Candidatus Omnitrophota bacterium]